MMEKATGESLRYERILAWPAAFLMAVFLTLSVLSALAVQLLTSTGLHAGTVTNDAILDEQIRRIYEYIDLLGEEYKFQPDVVKDTIGSDELRILNREAAAWWTKILTEGESSAVPQWYSSAAEKAVTEAMNSTGNADDSRIVFAEISDMINRTVFPLREAIMKFGSDFISTRADIPAIIRSFRQLPLLCIVICILTAGLIALLMGRHIFLSLKYYGTAVAGAGLVMVTALIAYMVMQMKPMLAQASSGLADAFENLMHTMLLESGSLSLILILGGYMCLFIYRNRPVTHLKHTEHAV